LSQSSEKPISLTLKNKNKNYLSLTHPLQEEEKEEDDGDDEGTKFSSIFASKPWKKCNGYGEMGQEELSFFDPILSRKKKKEPHLAAFLQARDGRRAIGMEEWDPSFAGRRGRRRRNHIWQHFASKGWKRRNGCMGEWVSAAAAAAAEGEKVGVWVLCLPDGNDANLPKLLCTY
jgi:hypothetical protein